MGCLRLFSLLLPLPSRGRPVRALFLGPRRIGAIL